jgi:hypothetical protein
MLDRRKCFDQAFNDFVSWNFVVYFPGHNISNWDNGAEI